MGADSAADKVIYKAEESVRVRYINPYLAPDSKVIVYKQTKAPKGLPKMHFGCMPYDNGHLLFDPYERDVFVRDYLEDAVFLKRLYGSQEFINDKHRYCLWIDDDKLEQALENSVIRERVTRTRSFRLSSPDTGGRKLAQTPHQFREYFRLDSEKIIMPRVSSERREYIPVGYLDKDCVVSDAAFAIFDAPMWLFGVLTSKMHVVWMQIIGGKLKTDYRYPAQLCYNPFPFPRLSDAQKKDIEEAANRILVARDYHCEKTLAQLYDPQKMPEDLRKAHQVLDLLVDSCYQDVPFTSDEARWELLLKLYEKRTKKSSRKY